MRWGQGSLQEIDHVPFVRAADEARRDGAARPARSRRCIDEALAAAVRAAHRARRSSTSRSTSCSWRRRRREPAPLPRRAARPARRPARARRAPPRCCATRERPVIMAGTNLYWGHGEDALRELAEARGIPVFLNGLARGCLPADHELFFSRARSARR